MHERVESQLRALARRAGWASAPPAVVAAGLALACLAVACAVWRWWPSGSGPSSAVSGQVVARTAPTRSRDASPRSTSAPSASIDEQTAEGGSAGSTVCVDVVGAVRHPGVYVLAAGMRVAAAVEAAGGARDGAATDAINLAAKVEDGQQIVVPTKEQVADGTAVLGAGMPAAGTGAHPAAVAKVDLNSADVTQLDGLPGIGPATAAKIVADRQTNGRFKSVEDLTRVPGIGPKKLDSLKDLIVVR